MMCLLFLSIEGDVMLEKLKQTSPYWLMLALLYVGLPLVYNKLPMDTANYITIYFNHLLIFQPVGLFLLHLLHGARQGFFVFFPIGTAAVFMPIALLYYHLRLDAVFYFGAYLLIGYLGSCLGSHYFAKKKGEE